MAKGPSYQLWTLSTAWAIVSLFTWKWVATPRRGCVWLRM